MRKFKTVSIPIPADPTTISALIGVGVFVLGMLGYIIGDIRQPPAPAPEAQVIVVTATPVSSTAMQTPWPTALPTQIPPTAIATLAVQPIIAAAGAFQDLPRQPIYQAQVQPTAQPAALPPMTGQECAAAGAARAWSATWGPASNGCWVISPDGSQTEHLGTWEE
jgi:hypothetical protein